MSTKRKIGGRATKGEDAGATRAKTTKKAPAQARAAKTTKKDGEARRVTKQPAPKAKPPAAGPKVVDVTKTRRGSPVLLSRLETRAQELQLLTRIAKGLASSGAGGDFFTVYDKLEGSARAGLDALERGELPACAVEVAAAATVMALAKDYAVDGLLARALELLVARPDLARTARRVALLGAGSQSRSDNGWERGRLLMLRGDPPADALLEALDAVAAGDHSACARVDGLADENPSSPSIQWLAEVTAHVSGDSDRARRRRRALDDLLDSDMFGGVGLDVAMVAKMGREQLNREGSTVVEAWRALSSLPRMLGVRTDASAAERMAAQGPFLGLIVPPELERVVSGPTHYLLLGFRELYGLEVLHAALPELTAFARSARAEPN